MAAWLIGVSWFFFSVFFFGCAPPGANYWKMWLSNILSFSLLGATRIDSAQFSDKILKFLQMQKFSPRAAAPTQFSQMSIEWNGKQENTGHQQSWERKYPSRNRPSWSNSNFINLKSFLHFFAFPPPAEPVCVCDDRKWTSTTTIAVYFPPRTFSTKKGGRKKTSKHPFSTEEFFQRQRKKNPAQLWLYVNPDFRCYPWSNILTWNHIVGVTFGGKVFSQTPT